ncbi:MAG: UrcA family protein [Sphingobium sp.]
MPSKMIWVGACALALCPFTASANPFASDRASISVHDLDLSTAQGRAAMEMRIGNAATDVCGRSVSHLGPMVLTKATACRAEVSAELRQRIAGLHKTQTLASAD